MFDYEYVDLTTEEVEARRVLLDRAGRDAFLLPVLLLASVFVVRSISNLTGARSAQSTSKPNILQVYYRRLNWVLGNTYVEEFGPLHVQILGLLYISCLLYLIVQGTGKDYMHVTKAFAHVAVSQFPIHYLLAIKHPKSVITLATGLTHERLNAYHRFLGRIIHALLAVHALLYIRFFTNIEVLGKRIQDWDVRYGFMAITTVTLIGLLSTPGFRQETYHQLFYRSHVVLTLLLAIIVWLHVPYTRNYVALSGLFWVCNGVLRKSVMGAPATLKNEKVGEGLIKVSATRKVGRSWKNLVPGMHAYLNQGGLGPRTPFTAVKSHSKGDEVTIDFIVRDLGGPMTGYLGELATENQKPMKKFEVEGPYGEAQEYMPHVLEQINQPVLLVAGGVGATYALPIYLALVEKRKTTSDVKLVWIVKQAEDARWGIDVLRGQANRNVQIFITKGKDGGSSQSALSLPGVDVSTSRPRLTTVVDSFVKSSTKDNQPMTVMVCGPSGLSTDLRSAVGKHVWAGRKVQWFEEQFGFGGS